MPDLPIEFETEEIDFDLPNQEDVSNWLNLIIEEHDFELVNLTYIFCSDDYLHQINLEYLNHDTLTDIITFNNADVPGIIESDIFISIDRVKENAQLLNQSFTDELHRIMSHGVLHLLGYDDKSVASKEIMSKREDYCLSLRTF